MPFTAYANKRHVNRKPHQKVKKLKSKFLLNIGYLSQALNNPALKYILTVVHEYRWQGCSGLGNILRIPNVPNHKVLGVPSPYA